MTTPPSGLALDGRVTARVEQALVLVVPVDAVVLGPVPGDHLEDLSDSLDLAQTVPRDDDEVASFGLARTMISRGHVDLLSSPEPCLDAGVEPSGQSLIPGQ